MGKIKWLMLFIGVFTVITLLTWMFFGYIDMLGVLVNLIISTGFVFFFWWDNV